VSEAACATAHQALGGSYELCFNGVDIGAFEGVEPWPTEGPTVLFLGRHEERKGLGVLLEAFEQLRSRLTVADARTGAGSGSPPVLWVAGDGPQTSDLRRRHPDAADLRWLGVLPEEEKLRRLVGARVLCAPSLGGESFGMVLLEAMAARALVVASDIPGYRDAAGGHAVLVPPGDELALATALARLVAPGAATADGGEPSPAAGERGGTASGLDEAETDAAYAWAAHWSMDRLADWYERRYRTLVAEPVG
jgi:phosphatidylinositol alpha-mannosyltransferase